VKEKRKVSVDEAKRKVLEVLEDEEVYEFVVAPAMWDKEGKVWWTVTYWKKTGETAAGEVFLDFENDAKHERIIREQGFRKVDKNEIPEEIWQKIAEVVDSYVCELLGLYM
jgi:N-acetylglutamate synthase-like GNAT family acetyltransferase